MQSVAAGLLAALAALAVWGASASPHTEFINKKNKASEAQSTGKKIICYYPSWASYRDGAGKFEPSNIDTKLCTHILYSFAALDEATLTIKPFDSWLDIDKGFYRQVTALKAQGVKVSIAIGGWNESGGDKYSRLVNNPTSRRQFVTHVIQFIQKYSFDGLDLDWEYPRCWQGDCSRGPATDKEGFASLVRELSQEFRQRGLVLSAAVSANPNIIEQAYDVPTLSNSLDWIGVMTYDYHGSWDKKTGHVAPLYSTPGDDNPKFNADAGIKDWIARGADPSKVVMGIPFYGQSFTLADANNHGLNAPTSGPGKAGPLSKAEGNLIFTEICQKVKREGWQVVRDPQKRMGPYAYQGNQWVGYDDVEDVQRKSQYVNKNNLGGALVWALGSDDFTNACGCGRQPLLTAINNELRGTSTSTANCT